MRPSRLFPAIAAALTLQLSSCVTLINLETVRPPVVQVSNDQWKVLVVNRYDAAQASNQNDRVVEVFREGAYQAAGGAMGAIFNDSTFVLVNPDQAVMLPSSPASPQLSPEEIKQLYIHYPSHLILTLDNFDAKLDKSVESYENEDGFNSRVAHYDLQVLTNWTLYDSAGTVLDQTLIMKAAPYDSRAVISGLLALGPAMGRTGPAINQLAVESGYSYWDRLHPLPMLLERQVYAINQLLPSVLMLQSGQLKQALDALLPLAQDTNNKQSAKAAYNLAIAYEAAGDYERAVYWAKQAESKGDKLAAQLLELWIIAGIIE